MLDTLWFSNILYRHYPYAQEHEDKEPGWIKLYLAICHTRGWLHIIHSDGAPVAGYIARPSELSDPMEYATGGNCQFVDFAYGPNHYSEIISSLKEQPYEFTSWERLKHKRRWFIETKKLREKAFIRCCSR